MMMSNTGTSRSPFFTLGVAVIWVLTTHPLGVQASKICRTDVNGNTSCQEKISPLVITAIVVTSIAVIALIVAAVFYVHRTRLLREKAEKEVAFAVDQSQIQGPPIMIQEPEQATTYGAPYAMASAPSGPKPLTLSGVGSAPVHPQLTLNLASAGVPMKSPLATSYGYSQNGYPQTAPGNRAVFSSGMGSSSARGDGRYPFTGISSSQLPPMPPSPYGSGFTSRV